MSNPLGSSGIGSSEDRNEFIEIFNLGLEPVDLKGWKISDFDAVDEIVPFYLLSRDSNTILLPGGFALILDPEYPDSGEYHMPYGIPSCLLLTVSNTTIGDGLATTDPIVLISPKGDTISTYYFPFNPGDGVSVERVYPYGGDTPENWKASKDPSGSTPGRKNSVYSSPDFLLDSIRVEGNEVLVYFTNIYEEILSGTIKIFNDENRNNILDIGELIDTFPIFNIPKDSSFVVNFSLPFDDVYLVGFTLISKTIFRRIRIGNGVSDIVINEIMFAPEKAPEWIELFNRTPYKISLDSFRIDNNFSGKVEIPSQGYLVVTSDSISFLNYYGERPLSFLETKLSFSNEGDSVFVFDKDGFLLDYLFYKGSFANRNYSLERVNPEISSSNPTNWGSSVFPGGSPGEKNSIFAQYKKEKVNLAVFPKHFTPNGDGIDEMSVISFGLPYLRNKVTIKIYDRRGHLLRENSNLYGGETGEWVWDGKDQKGEVVPIDLYIVFLLIENIDGFEKVVDKTVISVGR